MEGLTSMPAESGLRGTYNNIRGKMNMVTMVIAFVLSIMVIHSNRQCEEGKGYPSSAPFVTMSYGVAIFILVILCILFALDIFAFAKTKMR